MGRNVVYNDPAPSLPCDFAYLRHPSEEEYQRRLRKIVGQFAAWLDDNDQDTTNYDWASIRSILPKPITTLYLFRDYPDWVEDKAFEKRNRFTPARANGEVPHAYYISWHNVDMYAVPARLRHECYVTTPEEITEMETSPLLPTPLAQQLRMSVETSCTERSN